MLIDFKTSDGRTISFRCDSVVDGVPVNPDLPHDFDDTPNEERPEHHRVWWNVPFIVRYESSEPDFLKHWKDGVRYDVRCLDGGAWDRSTWWGSFDNVQAAVKLAKSGKASYA